MVTYNVGDGVVTTPRKQLGWQVRPKPTATASTHLLNLDRLVKFPQIPVEISENLACLPALDAKIEHSYYRRGQICPQRGM